MTFQLHALAAEPYQDLSSCTDEELAARGILRLVVDGKPGYPCRVSLCDAEVGETVYAFTYMHHDVDSPYRSSGPIFVREGVATAKPGPNEIPLMFRHRLLSLRGYDEAAIMIAAEVVQGTALEEALERILGDPRVSYVHVHNAGPGCFDCRVDRA